MINKKVDNSNLIQLNRPFNTNNLCRCILCMSRKGGVRSRKSVNHFSSFSFLHLAKITWVGLRNTDMLVNLFLASEAGYFALEEH